MEVCGGTRVPRIRKDYEYAKSRRLQYILPCHNKSPPMLNYLSISLRKDHTPTFSLHEDAIGLRTSVWGGGALITWSSTFSKDYEFAIRCPYTQNIYHTKQMQIEENCWLIVGIVGLIIH